MDKLRSFGLDEEHAHGIFGRSLRNQENFSAWMEERRRVDERREGEYRDHANEVAKSLATVDDKE